MIKLIVSDVDGTLLKKGETKLPDGMIERINELGDQGIAFAVASGRQYGNLRRLFKQAKHDILYIAENGALVVYKGKILNKIPINRMLGMEIMEDIWNTEGCEILLSGRDTSYLMPKKISYFEHIEKVIGNQCTIVEDFAAIDEDFLKLSAYNESGINEYSDYFIDKWGDRVKAVVSGECWLDFTNRFADKGSAVAMFQKQHGISIEDTMTFGDSYNDLEMFERSYFSYAMQHADGKIKQAARHITPDVESILTDVLRMR